jgi:antirestriction protein ArdC
MNIMTNSAYQIVTDRILEQLDKGIIPWKKTWVGSPPINYVTRKPYQGINRLLLSQNCGGEYLTFNQCKELGGFVKKGEKGHMIVFYKLLEKEKLVGDEKTQHIPFLKYSTVFHISQCTGIESRLDDNRNSDIKPMHSGQNIIAHYIAQSGVNYMEKEGNDRAFYSPADDKIVMPSMPQFDSTNSYYSTAMHECVHSTGHKTRFDRLKDVAAFGSEAYSKEELIAEIGACFLMNEAGIDVAETFTNTIAYIQGWISKLKNDPKIIVTASSAAQKAADYILNIEND